MPIDMNWQNAVIGMALIALVLAVFWFFGSNLRARLSRSPTSEWVAENEASISALVEDGIIAQEERSRELEAKIAEARKSPGTARRKVTVDDVTSVSSRIDALRDSIAERARTR